MTQEKEIWRPVAEYEGYYEVSNMGRVKSLPVTVEINAGYFKVKKERILKDQCNGRGYRTLGLSKKGIVRGFTVHRMVATAFIPNPDNYPFINHIDGDRANNHVSNLEWCTPLMNMRHAHLVTKTMKRPPVLTGADNARSRAVLKCLPDGTVIQKYDCLTAAAKDNNRTTSSICSALRGRVDGLTAGFIWKYAS
jgi:hypothetical protein